MNGGKGFITTVVAAVLLGTAAEPATLVARAARPASVAVPVKRITAVAHRDGTGKTVYRIVSLTLSAGVLGAGDCADFASP